MKHLVHSFTLFVVLILAACGSENKDNVANNPEAVATAFLDAEQAHDAAKIVKLFYYEGKENPYKPATYQSGFDEIASDSRLEKYDIILSKQVASEPDYATVQYNAFLANGKVLSNKQLTLRRNSKGKWGVIPTAENLYYTYDR